MNDPFVLLGKELVRVAVDASPRRSASFRRHSRHRQSPPSSGIGMRASSSAHQQDASRLQVNAVPHWEQTRRRDEPISNRFFINCSQRRLGFSCSVHALPQYIAKRILKRGARLREAQGKLDGPRFAKRTRCP